MKKILSLFLASLLSLGMLKAQTTLTAGDIAIVAYNYADPDQIQFVALVDIAQNTTINFTDNAWTGTALTTNEGTFVWTASTSIAKGTVVNMNTTGMNLALGGDQVIAYQGSAASPTFIYALTSNAWITSGSTTSNTSYLPSGLTNGSTAVSFSSNVANGYYNVTTNSGTKAALLSAISNSANWTRSSTRYASFPNYSFTVSTSSSPTVLAAGDIAIISYNFADPDQVRFVALVDINQNTVISFTDNAWTGSALTTNEGTYVYTASSNIAKGTIVSMNTTGMNLVTGGDQVIAYQGTAGSPTFIYALTSNAWITSGTPTTNNSYIPSGLTSGSTAVSFSSNVANGYYNVTSISNTKSAILSSISNNANWTRSSTRYASFPNNIFTITTGPSYDPEPTANPTNLNATNIKSWNFTVNYTGVSGVSGYIVLRGMNGSYPSTDPSDGVSYLQGDAIGNSKVAYIGTATTFLQQDVVAGKTYYYKVYAYNGTGTARNYRQTSPLQGTITSAKNMKGVYYGTITPSNSNFLTNLQTKVRSPYTKITYANYAPYLIDNFYRRDTTGGQKVVTCVYSGYNFVYSGSFAWGTMSREHTWCHSWMPTYASESGNEYSDLHHLFPTHQNNANGVRSNHPLDVVTSVTSTFLEGKYGKNQYNHNVYEPRNRQKGDAARALLYMSMRYNGVSGYNWTFNNLKTIMANLTNPEDSQNVQRLLLWHNLDPVDSFEVARNDYIQSVQQNRNPFIDNPTWVNHINFYNMTYVQNPEPFTAIYTPESGINRVIAFPNPVNNQVNIGIDAIQAKNTSLEVYDMMGNLIQTSQVTIPTGYSIQTLSTEKLSSGVYMVKIQGTANAIRIIKN